MKVKPEIYNRYIGAGICVLEIDFYSYLGGWVSLVKLGDKSSKIWNSEVGKWKDSEASVTELARRENIRES